MTESLSKSQSTLFSSWFFWRAYGAVALGIIAVALLLDALLAVFIREDAESTLLNSYAPLMELLGNELSAAPEAERTAHLQQVAANWDFPVALVRLDDFAGLPELTAQLQAGTVQIFYDNDSAAQLYQRLADSDTVLMLGPLPQPASHSTLEIIIIAIYYTMIALVLLLWIWPFYRDLSLLRHAAVDFGKADFSTRVSLNRKSSILPVAQAFNAMAERIESLVSAHKELTHAVSHELRTPLARFKFSMEMLARTIDPLKKQQYLDNMKDDVAELETLIDEMLSYARLSEQNLLLNLVDVDLQRWLQQEVAAYSQEKIRVTCSYAAPITGDFRVSCHPDLMARAVHNIIRNGLRYASATITVHAQLSHETATIRICDDGPGIPEAMQELVFEPFSRLETSRDKATGGYGLGLAIAARILQRHRGSIRVDNCEPCGACFKLEWPRLSR
ncbi:MAG: ATP-binding protein [Pseudomonadota bacterium]